MTRFKKYIFGILLEYYCKKVIEYIHWIQFFATIRIYFEYYLKVF